MTINPSLLLLILPAIILLFGIVLYNKMIRLRNHCDEAWSNIDTELKRRYNLIPNLVNTVKGFAAHEQNVLEEVTRLRATCAADEGSPRHQAGTENQLVQALNQLLVRVEAYPDLKASDHFLQLQTELALTEDRIQAARRFYNGNVREHNNAIQTLPGNLLAAACKFHPREFFEIEHAHFRQAPNTHL
jgi:LemA protein